MFQKFVRFTSEPLSKLHSHGQKILLIIHRSLIIGTFKLFQVEICDIRFPGSEGDLL